LLIYDFVNALIFDQLEFSHANMDRIRNMTPEEKEVGFKCVKRAGIHGIIGAGIASLSATAFSKIKKLPYQQK
jgi:hypothetical protein